MNPIPDSIVPLLEAMRQLNASDLHLKVGSPPTYRLASHLRRADMPAFEVNERKIEQLMEPILPAKRASEYERRGALDFSFHLPDGDRFRINVLRSCDHMHAAIRRVKAEIPNFNELHLPEVYKTLSEATHDGIIIVCGVTGSGKSSTMAAMIDHINATQHCNIISIEDPIEFALKPKQSIISQREIGIDLETFADGVRSAVRQDPDVIFVGEMRDRDTVYAALQAAETGHLVFGTLHTADTMQSLTRMLEFFPQDQHHFIRTAIANSLRAVLAQRLLPSIDEQVARVPATEVLIVDGVVREKIRDGEDEDLPEIITSNPGLGMQSFNMSLAELVDRDMVYVDTAMEYSPNRDQLRGHLRGIKTSASTMVHRVKNR